MAGHFALGNSNTLATIDVAGAFIVCHLFFCNKFHMSTLFSALHFRFKFSMNIYVLSKVITFRLQGISSHSTFLSGVLMFIITYASPMLFFFCLVLYISVKVTVCPLVTEGGNSGEILKSLLGFPCLVPLSINSIFLSANTIVLLLMRNHLFIWSVFSPKWVLPRIWCLEFDKWLNKKLFCDLLNLILK